MERGQVRTSELTRAGVHRPMLGLMLRDGLLNKLGYGLYGPGPAAANYLACLQSIECEFLPTAA